jgi:Reverse transcriptase (RNA-dependent DNA polymerase)
MLIIVIQKLNYLKVSQVLIQWSSSFLADRQQRVKISDVYYNWITLRGGMPEGSFLGPLIFLITINDLTAQCLLYKFLDDVTLSETVVQGTPSCFNSSIEQIIVSSKQNHMNINWNKTKKMILGLVKVLIAQPLRVEEHAIHRVDSFKLLGLIIDSNLRWNKHVEFICSKASHRLHYFKDFKT